jgi:hypothetical protein
MQLARRYRLPLNSTHARARNAATALSDSTMSTFSFAKKLKKKNGFFWTNRQQTLIQLRVELSLPFTQLDCEALCSHQSSCARLAFAQTFAGESSDTKLRENSGKKKKKKKKKSFDVYQK